jgi:hypothetical protein
VVRSLEKLLCPFRKRRNNIKLSFEVGCLEMDWLWSVAIGEIARTVERSSTNKR